MAKFRLSTAILIVTIFLLCYFTTSRAQQTHGPSQLPVAVSAPAAGPLPRGQIEVAPAVQADLHPADLQQQTPQELQEVPETGPGRLNQFQGFYTPRPLPAGAQFTFASVWASWSAWSFCTGGVQMRVRACNTVRGFSCLGSNKEIRPCEEIRSPTRFREIQLPPVLTAAGDGIYQVDDPWAEDRQEALRQLSQRDPVPVMISQPTADQQDNHREVQAVQSVAIQPVEAAPVDEQQQSSPKPSYWALRGQHAHYGTIAWGGGKNGTKNQLHSSKTATSQAEKSKKSESVEEIEVGDLARRLELEEPSQLAKQLIELEQKDKADKRASSTPPTSQSSTSPSVITVQTTVPSKRPTTTKSSSKLHANSVEDITQEWWRERHRFRASSEATVSTDFWDTEHTIAAVTKGAPRQSVVPSKPGARPRPAFAQRNSTDLGRHTGRSGRKRPPPSSFTRNRPNITANRRPAIAAGLPRYQQIARNLQGRPVERMSARERSIAALMDAQKRKQYRKDGEADGSGTGSSDTARALEWMLANMSKSLEQQQHFFQPVPAGDEQQREVQAVQSKLHSGDAPPGHRDEEETQFMPQHTSSKSPKPNYRNPGRVSPTVTPKSRAFGPGKVRKIIDENELEESREAEESKEMALDTHRKRLITELSRAQKAKTKESDANQELEREIARLRADLHTMESKMRLINQGAESKTSTVTPPTPTTKIISIADDSGGEYDSEEMDDEEEQKSEREPKILASKRPYEIGPMRIEQQQVPPVRSANMSSNEKLDISWVDGTTPATTKAEWSAWGEWGECICGKQMRARTCQYENAFHSNGCSGRSYETRRCFSTTANCPTTRRPPLPPSRLAAAASSSASSDEDLMEALRKESQESPDNMRSQESPNDNSAQSPPGSPQPSIAGNNPLQSPQQSQQHVLISDNIQSPPQGSPQFAVTGDNPLQHSPLAVAVNPHSTQPVMVSDNVQSPQGSPQPAVAGDHSLLPQSLPPTVAGDYSPAQTLPPSRAAQFRHSLRRSPLSIVSLSQAGGMRLRRLMR